MHDSPMTDAGVATSSAPSYSSRIRDVLAHIEANHGSPIPMRVCGSTPGKYRGENRVGDSPVDRRSA